MQWFQKCRPGLPVGWWRFGGAHGILGFLSGLVKDIKVAAFISTIFFVVLVLLCFYLNERTKVRCSGADPVTHRTALWFWVVLHEIAALPFFNNSWYRFNAPHGSCYLELILEPFKLFSNIAINNKNLSKIIVKILFNFKGQQYFRRNK